MTNDIIEAAAKIVQDRATDCLERSKRLVFPQERSEWENMASELDILADKILDLHIAMPVPSPWRDIETAPKDRIIEVYAPAFEDALGPMISLCQWHPDAGFCICQLRRPTHWREHIAPEQPS